MLSCRLEEIFLSLRITCCLHCQCLFLSRGRKTKTVVARKKPPLYHFVQHKILTACYFAKIYFWHVWLLNWLVCLHEFLPLSTVLYSPSVLNHTNSSFNLLKVIPLLKLLEDIWTWEGIVITSLQDTRKAELESKMVGINRIQPWSAFFMGIWIS